MMPQNHHSQHHQITVLYNLNLSHNNYANNEVHVMWILCKIQLLNFLSIAIQVTQTS